MTPEDPKRGGFITGGQLRAYPDDVTAYLLPPGERWVRLADLPERQKNGAAAMTPEERAKAIADDTEDRWSYYLEGELIVNQYKLADLIAAAIREAVNEKLEQAARPFDAAGDDMEDDIAEKIRELKHPD